MRLDIVTLMMAGSFVAGLAALLLGGAWISIRERALGWWAAANAILSVAVTMLAFGLASVDLTITAIGGALTVVPPALVWGGTRVFSDRRASIAVLLAGPLAVVAAGAAPLAGDPQQLARVASFTATIAYLLAATWELWIGRAEPLRARWPLMGLFALHAAVFGGGIVDTLSGSLGVMGVPLTIGGWFGIIHFESMIYSMGTAVLMVLICKERSERIFRDAARTDSLTGAASRGAFMAQAGQLLARCRKGGLPLTLVVFDLDRFKEINDTYGHKTGDEILRVFAESARRILRPNDVFGRHGGEEFAIVIPAATIETGYAIAERIRIAFAEACRHLENPMPVTVSAGAAAIASETSFDELMEAADAALYRAKNLGRNRVERAETGDTGARPPKVIRVA